MLDKLEAIQDRYYYLEEKLSDPEVLSDMKQFAKINKEYKDLTEIVESFKAYKLTTDSIHHTRSMLKDPDPDMREMAEMELQSLIEKQESLDEHIKYLLIPKDPEDAK
ncbi:MAG: PCRF domain-containing protein, partial [Saprospiraceae bacterium]